MNEIKRPLSIQLKMSDWRAWVAMCFVLLGASSIYRGIETLDWPAKVTWFGYLQFGIPGIVAGAIELLVGMSILARAIANR